jgi:hypothetical protein
MTTHIKVKWETVFNAAVDKETALEKELVSVKEEYIQNMMSETTGILLWKRKYTREEAERHYENDWCMRMQKTIFKKRIKRAKALQNISYQASKGYVDNIEYVYLSIDDNEFLFGDRS